MNSTKNDLPQKIRKKICELLNDILADLIDLQLQAKQAYWNVTGPSSAALRVLFRSVESRVLKYTDTVALRIVALGGTAEGTLAAVGNRTTLAAYSLKNMQGLDHVDALSSALESVATMVRDAINTASDINDAHTAIILTKVSRKLDKLHWFVMANLQDE